MRTLSPTQSMNSDGIMFCYRQFFRNFLNEIDFTSDKSANFQINISLSNYQLEELNKFAISQDLKMASGSVQDVTEILTSMFRNVDSLKVEELYATLSNFVITVAMNPRFLEIVYILTISVYYWNGYSSRPIIRTLVVHFFLVNLLNNQ